MVNHVGDRLEGWPCIPSNHHAKLLGAESKRRVSSVEGGLKEHLQNGLATSIECGQSIVSDIIDMCVILI